MPDDDADATRDALLNGRFHLWQPRSRGLRAGHDALLVASGVPRDASGRALDMGAGTGAVGLTAACRAPHIAMTLAEREPVLVRLLDRTIAETDSALRPRIRIAAVDLLERRAAREAAGLHDGSFDWVLTNPPFHPAAGRRSPDVLRASAVTMPDHDFLARWLSVAAALLRHGGRIVMIARPDNLAALLQGTENRFGAVTVMPVHSEGRAAQRMLVGAVRGSRAPIRILRSFVLDEPARKAMSDGEADLTLFDI